MTYLQLFISFFQIGLFSIGGGYAALPLIQEQVVNLHGWMDMTQFIDIITISQMTPGPIAINAATFVGIKTAGIGGAVIATFFKNGLVQFAADNIDFVAVVLFAVSLFILRKFKLNPIYVMLGCGVIGMGIYAARNFMA